MKVTIHKSNEVSSLFSINRGESVKILSGKYENCHAMVVTKVDNSITGVSVVLLDQEILEDIVTLPNDTLVVVVESELNIIDPFGV